jgi:hypothetical protein
MMTSIRHNFEHFYQNQRLMQNQENLANGGNGGYFADANSNTGDNIDRKLVDWFTGMFTTGKPAPTDITKDFQNQQNALLNQVALLQNDSNEDDALALGTIAQSLQIDRTGVSNIALKQLAIEYGDKLKNLSSNKLTLMDATSNVFNMQNAYHNFIGDQQTMLDEAKAGGYRDLQAERIKNFASQEFGNMGSDLQSMLSTRLVDAGVPQATFDAVWKAYNEATGEPGQKYQIALKTLQLEINKEVAKQAKAEGKKVNPNKVLRQAYTATDADGNALRSMLNAQLDLTTAQDLNPNHIIEKTLNSSAGLTGGTSLKKNEVTRVAGNDIVGGMKTQAGTWINKDSQVLHDFDMNNNGLIEKGPDGKLYHVVTSYDDKTNARETSKYLLPWSADEFTEKIKPSLSASKVFEARNKTGTTYVQKQDGQARGDLYAVKTSGDDDDAKAQKALESVRKRAIASDLKQQPDPAKVETIAKADKVFTKRHTNEYKIASSNTDIDSKKNTIKTGSELTSTPDRKTQLSPEYWRAYAKTRRDKSEQETYMAKADAMEKDQAKSGTYAKEF